MQPGEGALDHPAHRAQPGAVRDAAPGDHRLAAALPQQTTVLVEVEVVALIGIQTPRAAAGTASQTPTRWDCVQQWQELGDVMAVATGERDDERGAMAVDDQMVLGAGTGTGEGPTRPPLRAWT